MSMGVNVSLGVESGKIELWKNEKLALFTEALAEFHSENFVEKIKIRNFSINKNKMEIAGSSENFTCFVTVSKENERCDFRYKITSENPNPLKGRFKIVFNFTDPGKPKWLVPGIFYNDNSVDKAVRRYPKYSEETIDKDNFISNYWSFSSSRMAVPAVFCRGEKFTVGILTETEFSHGTTGLYFKGSLKEKQMGIILPYSEEPVSYSEFKGNVPVVNKIEVKKSDEIEFLFWIFILDPEPYSYDSAIRWFYYNVRDRNKLSPWFTLEKGAEISAYGLYRWHYDEKNSVIYETRDFTNLSSVRPHMHVSWVSGIPYAYSLMKYGYLTNNKSYIEAGKSVIHKIVNEGKSPAGTLWSQWTLENGWTDGWNPEPGLTQARTLSEAVLFLVRAYEFEEKNGNEHENWKRCIFQNLNYAIKVQKPDGNFGSYYSSRTGEVKIYDWRAGLMWISALCEAYRVFKNEKFKESAIKAGRYYSRFVLDGFIYGAPEDAFMVPTSEDAYNALISYVLLYEITEDETWLEIATRSASLIMTFRFAHNLKFDKGTILNAYDFKTRGADIASPVNQHLHNYGLITVPEILKLYKFTEDKYYFDRALDNICFSLQFIARYDGDFNAFMGMMPEQFYHTDWIRPAGTILPISHAWCLGMVVYAFVSVIESEFKDALLNSIKNYIG